MQSNRCRSNRIEILTRASRYTDTTKDAAELVREAVEAGLIKPAPPKRKLKPPVETRVCKCGAEFQARTATKLWCKTACFKQMQARRKLVWAVPKPCDTCGHQFTPGMPWAKRCRPCSEKPPRRERRLP